MRLFFLLFSLTSHIALDLPPSMPVLLKTWLPLRLQSHFPMWPTNKKQLLLPKFPAPLSHFAPTKLFLGSRIRRNTSAKNTLRRVQSLSKRSVGSNTIYFFLKLSIHTKSVRGRHFRACFEWDETRQEWSSNPKLGGPVQDYFIMVPLLGKFGKNLGKIREINKIW